MFQLQQRIGHDKNPLLDWKYKLEKAWNFNYLAAVAALMFTANKKISINFNDELKNNLKQHNHLLNELLPIKDIIKYGYPLFKHNIIFLDQITSEDSTKLKTWTQTIDITIPTKGHRLSPRKPVIFRKLENIIIDNYTDRSIRLYLCNNIFTNKPLSPYLTNR